MSDVGITDTDPDKPRILTFLECDLPRFLMQGSLSKRTRFSLRVDGPMDAREWRNLITLVEAQLAVLDDEVTP